MVMIVRMAPNNGPVLKSYLPSHTLDYILGPEIKSGGWLLFERVDEGRIEIWINTITEEELWVTFLD